MTRFGVVVLSVLGIGGLAACGGTASAANPSPSPSAGSQFARNGAFGQLVQINGTTLTLSGTNGDETVVYTGTTKFLRTSTVQVGDITSGACLLTTGTKDSTGAVTAATATMLQVSSASDCTQQAIAGAIGFGGRGGGTFTPRPGFTPRPRPSASPNPNFASVVGVVSSVNGTNSFTVQGAGGEVPVTIPSTVHVSKLVYIAASDLVVGECATAAGPRDSSSGTVTASTITISSPNSSGQCVPAGFGGRRGGGGGGGFGGGGGPFGGGAGDGGGQPPAAAPPGL